MALKEVSDMNADREAYSLLQMSSSILCSSCWISFLKTVSSLKVLGIMKRMVGFFCKKNSLPLCRATRWDSKSSSALRSGMIAQQLMMFEFANLKPSLLRKSSSFCGFSWRGSFTAASPETTLDFDGPHLEVAGAFLSLLPHVEAEVDQLQRVAEVVDGEDDGDGDCSESDRRVEGVHPDVLLVVDELFDWDEARLVYLDPDAHAADERRVEDEEAEEDEGEHSKEHHVREACFSRLYRRSLRCASSSLRRLRGACATAA